MLESYVLKDLSGGGTMLIAAGTLQCVTDVASIHLSNVPKAELQMLQCIIDDSYKATWRVVPFEIKTSVQVIVGLPLENSARHAS